MGTGTVVAILAPVIGVIGAAGVSVLTLYLRGLRTDVAGVETRLDKRFDKVDERFDNVDERFVKVEGDITRITESLVRIEVTLDAHGKQLERMADQGEGIATLEGAVAAIA